MQAASSLVSCAEPDVVFESLVQRCAPLVCEAATATVSRLDGRIYATTWPMGAPSHWSQPQSVVVDFNAPASGDYAGYHGLVSFRFRRQDESRPFVAQLLVDRAMAVVERERLRRGRRQSRGSGGPARDGPRPRTGRSVSRWGS